MAIAPFSNFFFLEKGRCLAYRDVAKKQTSQLTSSREVDIHTVDHQLPFEDVQVLNVYTFQFKTGKLQSDSNYQETIQIQHQYPTSPHVILQFTVPSLTAAAKIRRLVTLPPTQVCLVVSLTVVFCSDLTASSIVAIGRAAWIRYTLKSPRQETTPNYSHKDDHPSCPNPFNTMPNIQKYPSKTATLGLNQAQPSYYINTQKGLREQDPKHPGNPARALFLAQAVTPPCRCRPVPTRQKVRWDHSMPSRPTCACRCRLLLATRLFQIPPG